MTKPKDKRLTEEAFYNVLQAIFDNAKMSPRMLVNNGGLADAIKAHEERLAKGGKK